MHPFISPGEQKAWILLKLLNKKSHLWKIKSSSRKRIKKGVWAPAGVSFASKIRKDRNWATRISSRIRKVPALTPQNTKYNQECSVSSSWRLTKEHVLHQFITRKLAWVRLSKLWTKRKKKKKPLVAGVARTRGPHSGITRRFGVRVFRINVNGFFERN